MLKIGKLYKLNFWDGELAWEQNPRTLIEMPIGSIVHMIKKINERYYEILFEGKILTLRINPNAKEFYEEINLLDQNEQSS